MSDGFTDWNEERKLNEAKQIKLKLELEDEKKKIGRSRVLQSSTYKFNLCTGIFITVTHDENKKPLEIFVSLGKMGTCESAQVDTICRCVSVGLRSGVEPTEFISQLSHINCNKGAFNDGTFVKSCGDAIARVLDDFILKDKDKTFLKRG